jgi:Ca2+-dependent lipid-binding protein
MELFISCQNLADLDIFTVSDPYIIMYVKNKGNCIISIFKYAGLEYGRTELIWNNLNPTFAKSFIIEYFFEVQQYLRFDVYHYIGPKRSTLIGSANMTLAELVGSRDKSLTRELLNQRGRQ